MEENLGGCGGGDSDGTNLATDAMVAAIANNRHEPTESREEGELSSSSSDHCQEAGSASQFADCNAAQVESVQVVPLNKISQDIKSEICKPANKSSSMVDVSSSAYLQLDHHKGSEKNRGQFVPFVIRFSDDDSGSDSDDNRRNTLESKDYTQGTDRSRRPPLPSFQKSQKLQQNRVKDATMMPRQKSLTRPVISSKAKINEATSRNAGQISSFRNLNYLKEGADQDQQHRTNVHLNTTKMQDLRQLIEIRENQIKLKTTQQTKNSVTGSHRDNNAQNLSNPVSRVHKAAHVHDLQSDLDSPDKKRLKTGEPQSSKLRLDCHKNFDSVGQMLPLEKSTLDNCGKQNVEGCCHCGKNNALRTSHASHSGEQKQNVRQSPLSSANHLIVGNDGPQIVASSIVGDVNAEIAGPIVSPSQTGQTGKRHAGDFPLIPSNVELTQTHCQDVVIHLQNRHNSGNDAIERSDRDQVKSSENIIKVNSNDKNQASAFHSLDSNRQAPTSNASFSNCLDKLSMMGSNNMDIPSMLDFEDLLDKELEAAQEHRRNCEIDERNALTAYRKAQRALVEANARCSHLYSKRELYSAQLRSLMMQNPNQFFSSRPHNQNEAGLSVSNKISNVDAHLIPASSHHVQAASDINGRRGCDSNIHPANSAFQNQSHLNVDGQNLVSDPCVEPDGSSSEAHKRDDVSNGVCCPSDDLNEDNEIFQLEPKSAQDNFESVQTSEYDAGRNKDRNHGSEGQLSFDSHRDSLLLEASLKSQLYEKLRTKILLKRGTSQNIESVSERVGNDDGGKMTGKIAVNASLCAAETDKHSDFESVNKAGRFSELPVQISSHSDMIPSEHASPAVGDPISSNFSLEGPQSTISVTFLCPSMKSAFIHLKAAEPVGALQSQTTSSDILSSDISEKSVDHNVFTESRAIRLSADTTEKMALSLCDGQSGYYSCNLAIDPLWPLCMFELRGKCNNDECSWQHVKDYSCTNMQHDTIDDADFQVQKQSQREEFSSSAIVSKSLDHLVLAPPTYMVVSDVLKPDSQSYKSLLTQDYGQCWQKCFSTFLVFSSLFATASGSNEPFLHGTEARIEVHSDWNRQSSYFHSRNGKAGQVDQSFADVDQSLEMALLNFCKEADKQKGRIEALKVLVPAIEANPRSAVLWMVYLQIYYLNQKSIGKDDLFEYAVEFNKESYELWLLYINSREQLDDRLAAYDAALSALSHHASAASGEALHASQCILDIFLQMMDFMCGSGNFGKAIEIISGLILSTKKTDEPCELTLPNVISCLTIFDKFIFWISCVYIVLYKKLPHPMVHSFECWKESFILEWPDVHLTFDEKQQAASLMEMAVDSLVLYMDRESLENEKTLRAAHLFALNHVRCVSVLEGLECTKLLLEKYIKLYPSCLELVLMAARAEYHMGGLSFDGFEEALRNWPDEVPGVQCIWNQYAECALRSGKFDFVKELMGRWFHSILEARDSHHEVLHTNGSDDSNALLQLASASDLCAWFSDYSKTDIVFGILNLSLCKILQNDHTDALFALNQALKAASADNYCHCLRELAMFLLTNSIQHYGEAHVKRILSILNVHLADARAWVAAEPLSRVFKQKIGKPRVRQLVSKMLRPVSADFSMMNMVVEVWHGLLLIPQICDNLMDLVDFVEGVMEIMPSNYLLAISICKLLIKSSNSLNNSASISFWASSLLVNALSHAVPVAPEYIWVEAADVLLNLTNSQTIGESFHKKALSVYPFSIKLWKSYLRLSEAAEHGNSVKEAAKEKGLVLD